MGTFVGTPYTIAPNLVRLKTPQCKSVTYWPRRRCRPAAEAVGGGAEFGQGDPEVGDLKKRLELAGRPEVVRVREEFRVSERRACGLIGVARSSCRYRRKERGDAKLRAALRELALERPRWGYRRLWVMLRRQGWEVNRKRVYRLYREEGLAVRRRKRKRVAVERQPLRLPLRGNEVWTMDYTHDALMSGRKFRTLNLMDGYTRQALAIEVDTSLPGPRVVRVLEGLSQERGVPERIQVDNGPEFISQVVDQWAHERGAKLNFIRPGKPTDNGRIESFNGKFRDECLNQYWFVNLVEARERIDAWRRTTIRSGPTAAWDTEPRRSSRRRRREGPLPPRPSPSQNQS